MPPVYGLLLNVSRSYLAGFVYVCVCVFLCVCFTMGRNFDFRPAFPPHSFLDWYVVALGFVEQLTLG